MLKVAFGFITGFSLAAWLLQPPLPMQVGHDLDQIATSWSMARPLAC